MPRLEAMSIGSRNCPDLGLFCLKDFAKLPRFETANDNMFTDETFKYIATAPVIEHVTNMYCRDDHVHRTGDSFVAYLAASSTIKSVSTWGSHITDEALIALAGMKQLESLLFQNCHRITDAGIRHLAALPKLTKLTKLTVSDCPGITSACAAAFGRSVAIDL